MVAPVKGMQDFLDLTRYNFIIDQVRKHVQLYHFTEVATPIVEHTELFQRSLGVATDVVSKEMFIIAPKNEDSESASMCLRPEATASLVRAFVNHGVTQTPWKVFTFGPMFRYERPQKGRYRQFHQMDFEIIGAPSIAYDVQLITMLDRLFHEKLQFNNYALVLNFLGCANDRAEYKKKLEQFLAVQTGLCANCVERKEKNSLRVFDCKNEHCQELYRNAPVITDSLCAACEGEWQQLQEQLELLSVSFTVKPTLVRGLDYYGKTVFEFVSNVLGAQNAFCGGGRFDQLVKELGGHQDQPSVGAAFGIERVMLMLEQSKNQPLPAQPPLYVVLPMGKEQQGLALLLADQLRAHMLCVDVLFGDSFKTLMKKANNAGAAYALILGEDEQKSRTVMVKNMITGHQEKVAQIEIVAHLRK